MICLLVLYTGFVLTKRQTHCAMLQGHAAEAPWPAETAQVLSVILDQCYPNTTNTS